MRKDYSFGVIPLKKEQGKWYVLLVQHQGGHWSFPKGHAELDEKPKDTATRELKEETNLSVVSYLQETPLEEVYIFKHKGELISKTVLYFLAEVEGIVEVQIEEIAHCSWFFLPESLNVLTFPQGRTIIQKVIHFLSRAS